LRQHSCAGSPGKVPSNSCIHPCRGWLPFSFGYFKKPRSVRISDIELERICAVIDSCSSRRNSHDSRGTSIIMKPHQKQQFENLGEEREFWDLYREMYQSKGVDIDDFYRAAVEEWKKELLEHGARTDFAELTMTGCSPVILGLLIAFTRYCPQLKNFWEHTIGDVKEREKAKRELEGAAARLERIFALTLTADDNMKEKLARSRFLMPSELISQLRLYVRLITLGERLMADPGIRSLGEFAKYLLAGYVKRATGKFCDRNVSGLLADLVGPISYDETAQRMWRRRNYAHLDKHLSTMVDGLNAMGTVMSRKPKT
jgi:hypothetical protein